MADGLLGRAFRRIPAVASAFELGARAAHSGEAFRNAILSMLAAGGTGAALGASALPAAGAATGAATGLAARQMVSVMPRFPVFDRTDREGVPFFTEVPGPVAIANTERRLAEAVRPIAEALTPRRPRRGPLGGINYVR